MWQWLSQPYPYTNPFATGPDPDAQTRRLIRNVIFTLYTLGGVTMASTLVLPSAPLGSDSARQTLLAIIVVMFAVALYTRFAPRIPDRWYLVACYLSLPIIAVYITLFEDLRPAAIFLMWPAMAGAFFGQARECFGGFVFGTLCYAVALFGFTTESFKWDWFTYVSTATGVAMTLVFVMKTRAIRLIARLDETARTDALTGVLNRGAFADELEQELQRARDTATPLAVISLDLDHFKQVNDLYGHAGGDDALRAVTQIITRVVPDDAVFARVGGEEFAVLLPGRDFGLALPIAERVREAVERDTAGQEPSLTVSVGVAAFPSAGDTPSALLLGADHALYAAKQTGRNRVVAADESEQRLLDLVDRHRTIETDAGSQTALRLAERLELHRRGEQRRSERVAEVVVLIAEEMRLEPEDIGRMRLAGLVRDVGMLGVPDEILAAGHALTPEERELVERHVQIGIEVLTACGLSELAAWVGAHHERPDGLGYPHGLRGEEIPLPARILAVAEAFTSLTSGPGVPTAVAIGELLDCAGSQFDERVVAALSDALLTHDDVPAARLAS